MTSPRRDREKESAVVVLGMIGRLLALVTGVSATLADKGIGWWVLAALVVHGAWGFIALWDVWRAR